MMVEVGVLAKADEIVGYTVGRLAGIDGEAFRAADFLNVDVSS